MLENLQKEDILKFHDLSAEEKLKRGILGRLSGPIASCVTPTRNGRKYTDKLWEKVFSNPIVKEMFDNGGLPGELAHPVDRSETDPLKIAIMMPKVPKKDSEGHLVASVDILDTPCGKIAYQLAKYGFNFGISSRGEGDVVEDWDGEEVVDENTYTLNAFDLVLLPACSDARLTFTESLQNKKTLHEALQEVVKQASEDDQKIMKETIDNLEFDNKDDSSEKEAESDVNIENEVAGNPGTDLVESLQQALLENSRLKKEVVALNEKLSVSYTKEVKLSEEVTSLKNSFSQLSKNVTSNEALRSRLKLVNEKLQQTISDSQRKDSIIEGYKQHLKDASMKKSSLKESITAKDTTIATLNEKVRTLAESLKATKQSSKVEMQKLTEELSSVKTDSAVKNKEYSKKLSNANKLVEKYRLVASNALDRYIASKALTLGISTNEIKNRLSENYSFDDIDNICESLRSYKLNMSKLPFNVGAASIEKMTLKEDTSTQRFLNPDDIVDKDLLDLIQK